MTYDPSAIDRALDLMQAEIDRQAAEAAAEAERLRRLNPIGRGAFLSLHVGDPAAHDGHEVSGAGYARQSVHFSPDDPHSKQPTLYNDHDIAWKNLPNGTVTHFGVWDAPEGGHLLCSGRFSRDAEMRPGDTFMIRQGDFTTDVRVDLLGGATPPRRSRWRL